MAQADNKITNAKVRNFFKASPIKNQIIYMSFENESSKFLKRHQAHDALNKFLIIFLQKIDTA